ncbi:hypothetical protein JOB18_003742 [Solea senegalensis]|uniref:Uncharacterized protein n=1 Tax=Solea senegalensis TaxID=28829 RepID=A0AAV6QRG2_SOLSE|nr:hypothetical protein JOB18_003742 [Solea senegalensis]KAG7495680.1 hypothetical protein JOB18_003742 [Solea senegalensis]KAG7495681.1 hypothetical protein JOB18_003742 [Solea senegalensis]KAG7495682.1 hypothetical protein JOB18_003742 [Solea senegalensis]KAG7495683.1 hypothetical protein JOB18_003742 [Solea senegalensis]
MSRITGVTLLLIILIGSLYDSTASSEFYVTKKHIRKCRCKVFPNGLVKCPFPLLPTNYKERMDLIKCLCRKTDRHKLQMFKAICTAWQPGFPITLV